MTGRKRLPTEVKKARGTLRKGRENPAAPDPATDRPMPPAYLDQASVEWFTVLEERMHELGTSSSSWTETIAAAAVRSAEVEALSKVLEEKGHIYTTTSSQGGVMIRARPEVAQRSDALRHLQSLLAELGLTPASRSKVTAQKKDKGNPFGALKLA